MTNKQSQKSGDHSMNIQSKGDVNIGITYSDARQIALDVFQANFIKLSEEAYEVAKIRAEKFVNDYLESLSDRNPGAISSSKDPDMQYALFTAQKEYARTGNDELAEILVDILVDRASKPDRSLLQIVLNESLLVAPKLPPYQYDTLSLIFIVRYSRRLNISNLNEFSEYIKNSIMPFAENIRPEAPCFQHLEYTGCGNIQVGSISLGKAFRKSYPGLFWKGFTKEHLEKLREQGDIPLKFIMPCFHNPELFQFNALNDDVITEKCNKAGISKERHDQLISFQNSYLMSEQEIAEAVISLDSSTKRLFETWNESSLKSFTLTSVGIAIAHANIRRKIRDEFDLNIWIN